MTFMQRHPNGTSTLSFSNVDELCSNEDEHLFMFCFHFCLLRLSVQLKILLIVSHITVI